MFLAWGHTGPMQPWSSKSRPQQKLPTALCPLLLRPFYIPCAAGERWDPARAADFGRPPRPIRGTQGVGGHPSSPPPHPPRAVCPCTRKHGRAHAWEWGYGGFRGAGFCGGRGFLVFLGGVLQAPRCPQGWLGGDWTCGTWRFGDPGATRRRELHQGPATPLSPPPQSPPSLKWGTPKTTPGSPRGLPPPPAGPNPGAVQGQGHQPLEHPLDGPQEHPLRDPNPKAPARTTGTPNPSPKGAHFVFLALSFPSFPSLSLSALAPRAPPLARLHGRFHI